MPLLLLPLLEQDIPAYAALDAAAMATLGLARAMSLSAPPDAPPRQQMIEEWTKKDLATLEETDSLYLKVVDTDLPATHGATDEGEIIAAAYWTFGEGGDAARKGNEGKGRAGQEDEKKEGLAGTGIGVEMMREWEEFRREFFPSQRYAILKVLATHPKHQRRGAGSMLVKRGVDEADKRGIISVLSATEKGLGCYLKNGFKLVSQVEMDLKPFGVDEVEIRRGMIRQPKSQ